MAAHNMGLVKIVLASLLSLLLCAALASAAEPALPPGFDPQRHMLVSEVKPGMKGYGLSVFSGTKIERFNVEVVSILKNFNPRQDVVLIRASGANLEHTGAIAGMSGSPVYLHDDAGKDRLIGAFAFGWPMMKDPLAGVQPIEYMLAMPLQKSEHAEGPAALPQRGQWSVTSAVTESGRRLGQTLAASRQPLTAPTRLLPLSVPLAISGMSQSAVGSLADPFSFMGLTPLQAGGQAHMDAPAKIEPGSVLAVPLLSGDIDMTAVGTCTEVIDGKVYGFGHPFTGTGPVDLPMCGGEIQGIIANLVTSFKLGSASDPVGTLLTDQSSGVAGQVGPSPQTAPMRWRVKYADGSLDHDYKFQAVIHPQFTPLLTSAAAFGAISAARQLPHYNTVSYRVRLDFSGGQTVTLADRIANVEPMSLFSAMGAPIAAITDNPFGRSLLKSVDGEVDVKEGAAAADLQHIGSSRQAYRPGETVRFFATLRPFRSVDVVRDLELKLPADLPEGSYTITASDLPHYLAEEQTASPFRFTAASLDDVFAAITDLTSLRSDAIYLRLSSTEPGVAIGRTSLPNMPASHRQMLLETGRPNVVAYMPCVTRIVPADWVIAGTANLSIQVSKRAHAGSE